MRTRPWIKLFFLVSLITMVIVSSFNFIINPYSIFGHGLDRAFSQKPHLLSDRMSKFYIVNRLKPQSVMMGTSRIGLFPSSQLTPYLEEPIINLSLVGATIDEQAALLQYLILHHPQLKNIIWSLDFFTFNPDKPMDQNFDPARLNETFYKNDYFISLFSFQTLNRTTKTVIKNLSSTNTDQNISGQPFTKEQIDFNIHYTLREYATEKSFLVSEKFKQPHSIDTKLLLVQKIVDLCKQHNVQCILYTSPVYYQHIDMIYSIGLGKTFEAWKIGIAEITPFTDFCNYNTITKNRMNFRDSSHVISDIGQLIFARIFEDKNVIIPNDFGYLVTPENMVFHINRDREMRTPFSFD